MLLHRAAEIEPPPDIGEARRRRRSSRRAARAARPRPSDASSASRATLRRLDAHRGHADALGMHDDAVDAFDHVASRSWRVQTRSVLVRRWRSRPTRSGNWDAGAAGIRGADTEDLPGRARVSGSSSRWRSTNLGRHERGRRGAAAGCRPRRVEPRQHRRDRLRGGAARPLRRGARRSTSRRSSAMRRAPYRIREQGHASRQEVAVRGARRARLVDEARPRVREGGRACCRRPATSVATTA